jgi:excisionase family DNA binding protein
MSTQPNLITPRERPHSVREAPVSQQYAARFLNMHPKTVLRKAREGSLPAHPVGTDRKRWHFYLSELDDWLRSQVITGKRARQYFGSSASASGAASTSE